MRQTDGRAVTLGGAAVDWHMAGIRAVPLMATYLMTPQPSNPVLWLRPGARHDQQNRPE